MTRKFTRLLRRNSIALLALFFALGGTSFAAATLINGKQIKPHTIAKNRLTNKAIKQLKGNRGLKGPQGVQGAKGATGAQGPAGTAVAYARILANGTVDATLSKGIVQSNVTHPATGFYCFAGLSFTPHNVVASPQFVARTAGTFINAGSGYASCPGTSQVSVGIYNDGAGGADAPGDSPFMIAIN